MMEHDTREEGTVLPLIRWALMALAIAGVPVAAAAQAEDPPGDTTPTLGLEQGVIPFVTSELRLDLVRASQTVAGLSPVDDPEFDFTPSDWLPRRAADGYYHLGDLTLRLRTADSGEWTHYSTAEQRHPVEALPATGRVLAAADLAPTLSPDLPLRVRRFWEVRGGHLVLRFELSNPTGAPVEIGALGIPMVFNNILTGRSLEEAHAVASFHDPYIGGDAGYLQVTRLNGHGPALVVAPFGDSPLEAWRPLLEDRTRRGITFEGFHEWLSHSRAYAENEWAGAEPWNAPTSHTLAPGESREYGVAFLVAPGIREIEETLGADGRPVALGVPGYVVPTDLEAKLFVRYPREVRSIEVEPEGALTFESTGWREGWQAFDVTGRTWGRARATVVYEDGLEQTISYKVIKPMARVVDNLGAFLTSEQWFERPEDPFDRSPSVISYDYEAGRPVTEDNRAWIAGLSDEGGAGSWLAAVMKQLVRPDTAEVARLQRFVDGVLWGGIQHDEGDRRFAVRKSLFYYEPEQMPEGTYTDSVRYGGWSSWSREEARSVGRSYNYPHVAAAHWVLYRLARNHEGLVTNHGWDWYLERAYETGQAMVRHAPYYAQFGQMEGTAFVLILMDLKREGWTEEAAALEATMRERAEVWRALAYPFGSEMPWDSTGQEEVYAWCTYFGFDEKARVTLNAILGYMPTVPHWGYNGSARRYWDFIFAGKLRRVERQLHHYGSALNAIPVLTEYRTRPDDFYLLRVGYAGMMGALANITEDGFAPAAFHSYPSTLRIDGYSGDYGPGFFGHAVNTGTYVVRHPELGWLAFGGTLTVEDGPAPTVRVEPRDAARSRVYLAPLGLWLTLDAGAFEAVTIAGDKVQVALAPAGTVRRARLRVEHPSEGAGELVPAGDHVRERDAWVVPLGEGPTTVTLRPRSGRGG